MTTINPRRPVLVAAGQHTQRVNLGEPSLEPPALLAAAARAALADAGAAPEQACIIGDTVFDMAMGANAGVRAIGVDWGYHDAHELIDAGAAHVADDADHLLALLNG